MSFKVRILGSGSAVPTTLRNPTAQYVFCHNRHILIDCAEGTQMLLRQHKISLQHIDIVLISHLHGDHYFGLVGLISTMDLLGREKKLTIYAPKNLEKIIRLQLEFQNFSLGFELEFILLDGKEAKEIYNDNIISIKTFPLKHSIPTNGFTIEEVSKKRRINKFLFELDKVPIPAAILFKDGKNYTATDGTVYDYLTYTHDPEPSKKYAYCSDTKYFEQIIPHIANADVLYHEATFTKEMQERAKKTFHSTAEQAATIAQKANVKRLILGHLSARYKTVFAHLDEAKPIFENTYVVSDGDEIVV
ncbi:MAG TPA: ribonuclease Z [Crocinitomicaceae bacterium]|nr:ribonuclease Z [Crocinitomicaceae bacterium]